MTQQQQHIVFSHPVVGSSKFLQNVHDGPQLIYGEMTFPLATWRPKENFFWGLSWSLTGEHLQTELRQRGLET